MGYATVKSLHIIFMVAWYAGLFYLPRLYVYHAMTPAEDRLGYGITGGWMHVKLLLVVVLVAYHAYLGVLRKAFARDANTHGHVFYRWLNEVPALPILVAVVFLVVMKPF